MVDLDIPLLIQLARNGDRGAQGQLLSRYLPRLARAARRRAGARLPGGARPSDLVQDAVERALRHLHGFTGETGAELEGWLRRILQSAVQTTLRAAGARKRRAGQELRLSEVPSAMAATATEATPSQAAAGRQEWRRIILGLRELPQRQREAVRLHFLSQQTMAEVAQALGCSENAAACLVQRGLRGLQRALGDSAAESFAAQVRGALCEGPPGEGPLSAKRGSPRSSPRSTGRPRSRSGTTPR